MSAGSAGSVRTVDSGGMAVFITAGSTKTRLGLSLVVATTIAALAGCGVGQAGVPQSGATVADERAGTAEDQVKAAFINAVRVERAVLVPPVDMVGDKPTEAQLLRQAADGAAAVHAVFAEAPAAQVLMGLDNVVASQRLDGDNVRVLGAGVGTVSFEQVTVTADRATVRAQVEMWMKTEARQPGRDWTVVEPRNVMDVTMELARDQAGAWIVEVYQWGFAGGGGP
jgi:hypothetical protein